MSLPKEINYASKPIQMPNGSNTRQVIALPINGSLFTDSSQIQFQLLQSGCLVPSSMYLRFRATILGQDATTDFIGSYPAYSFFYRNETKIGGITSESISDYGRICQMLLSCKSDYAQKLGLSSTYGIGLTSGQINLAFNNCNGWDLVATPDVRSLSIPINSLITNAEKFVPLFAMPLVEITLTLDSIANITRTGTTAASSFRLDNIELVYEVVDFSADVTNAILGMTDERGKIVIKSQSYLSSSQTIPQGAVGTLEYIYSMRLASIKSLYLLQGGTHAGAVNKLYDSFDNTNGKGSYAFMINGVQYPSREISTLNNKTATLTELAYSIGNHSITNATFSIHPIEFSYVGTSTSTALLPGKYWVGVNTEKISVNGLMLSGVSSQNSPISLRFTSNEPVSNMFQAMVVANFDAILKIDPMTKQTVVLQ